MLLIADLSAVCCMVAGGVSCVPLVSGRSRSAWLRALAVAFIAVALWMVAMSVYLRSPYSDARVRLFMALLCLVPIPWLIAALCVGERDGATLLRWKVPVAASAIGCTIAAAAMAMRGIDWITGIGADPAVVLSPWGSIAVAVSAAPACAALALLIRRLHTDATTMPGLWLGAVGQLCSVLWICASVLWHGYLSRSLLLSAGVLAGTGAVAAAVDLLRAVPAARPLAPSRRLVYGAAAASLLAAYIIAARWAFRWLMAAATTAVPHLIPVGVFAVIAGLVFTLGSRQARYRLWGAIGRHFFGSKHDYGEVWIQLTELVSHAASTSDLVQRAATFCCRLLCVPEVSIWLIDSAGRLSCRTGDGTARMQPPTLLAPPCDPGSIGERSRDAAGAPADDMAEFASSIGATLACPLRVNGDLLGFIAVGGPAQAVTLDDEDRRVVRHVAAQLASALALYRFGEEIADVREIGSFHRVSAFVLHDLKNLVAQQSLVIENAGRFRDDPRFVADALAAFEDSTNRMRALIGRLRSRGPSGASRSGSCDLLGLVRELVSMPHIAQRAGCSVRLVVPPDALSCTPMIDRGALAQVLGNLLVNAVESLPTEGGEVVVTVTPVLQGWQVQICDNGRGIPESFLREHLFRPFRTTKETGFGIGLYECKSLIEAARGTISIHSQEHVGTTVTVVVPAAPPSEAPQPRTPEGQYGQACSPSC